MLTRGQMLGRRYGRRRLLGWRRWRGQRRQLLRRLLLKVAELQLLVVAKLDLDRGGLQGRLGMGSLLNVLRGHDAYWLGSQLWCQPLGCVLLLHRGLGFQPGLHQLWGLRMASQLLLPGQQGRALQRPQLLGCHLRGLPKAVGCVYAGWGDLAFEGGRGWGAVGAAHRGGTQGWRLELV